MSHQDVLELEFLPSKPEPRAQILSQDTTII